MGNDKVFYGSLLILVSVVLFIGYAVYHESQKEKFSLNKNEWTCTASHKQVILVGKVPVMSTVCDNWKRME